MSQCEELYKLTEGKTTIEEENKLHTQKTLSAFLKYKAIQLYKQDTVYVYVFITLYI